VSQKREYLSFFEARNYVRSQNLQSAQEWKKWSNGTLDDKKRRPDFIPSSPDVVYKYDGWLGWSDWIKEKVEYLPFEEAREFVRNLHLKNTEEWQAYYQGKHHKLVKPDNIPWNPKYTYPNEWISLKDWLGLEWRTFEEAKEFVHTLGLKNQQEWRLYCKNELDGYEAKPGDIPTDPKRVYGNDGWMGFADWFGYNLENSEEEIGNNEFLVEQGSLSIFNLEKLLDKYKNNSTISKILSFFSSGVHHKSIVELDLSVDEVEEVEKLFFQLRGEPGKISPTKKAFLALLFLIYITHKLEKSVSYSLLWKVITSNLEQYTKVSSHFYNSYFTSQNQPNYFLKEALKYACILFNLRNELEEKDEHQVFRNTILLQIGLLNKSLGHLKLWLSNYNLPVIVSELLNIDSPNYSKTFHEGWRALRRFRDNILSSKQVRDILSQNIWFKHLNLDNLLKAAKQKAKKNLMLTQDEDLPVFFLEKINYSDDGLSFTVNAQDLYSLNLSGFRYEIYIDEEYKGVLIANSSKELILESPISIINPDVNQIDLEVRNEDNDVVFSTEIVLFDFSEQMVLFDEDGNIYQNIFKKLNAHKKYHLLIDSDLDCEFNCDFQREYFDGYANLVPFIGCKDDCKITYNNEVLFELNFTEHIEKPEFIDQLVLYATSNTSFAIDSEYIFELKIMQIDSKTEDADLKTLPNEAKIIKWSYQGGYADSEDIKDNCAISCSLYPEMITSPKHTLLIKYKNKVFKKVIYCNFFERQNKCRLFQIGSEGAKLVENTSFLTKNHLKKYRYFLSDFSRNEQLFLKNKSNFYQLIRPNKIINFSKLTGFGETLFLSEYLFNSALIEVFNYIDNEEYISLNQESLSEIYFHKELPAHSKLILLTSSFKEQEISYQEAQERISNNKISLEEKLISVLVIQGSSVVDSACDTHFLDNFNDYSNMKLIKNLIMANYPFLSTEAHSDFLRKFIANNVEDFFSVFYNDRIIINENFLRLDFLKINILIEHILFNMSISADKSESILQRTLLNKQEKLLLETPIILFNLLLGSGSKKLLHYFYNLVIDAEIEDERDEDFINLIVDNLFETDVLKGMQKHNLKVAMHYINGKYYLKKALEKLNG
jgi:hypothetical protein